MRVNSFNSKNLITGILYFYIHFVTEVVCFYVLSNYVESPPIAWIITLAYDMLAFVPQSVIGYFSDRFPKIPLSLIGLPMMAIALVLQAHTSLIPLTLIFLCLGNACTHINGAEVTLRTSEGNLSHSAVFVAGGSFGVITGKLLSSAGTPYWLLLILIASAVPFVILAQMYITDKNGILGCEDFGYNNPKLNKHLVIILSVIIVVVRGYMAYGIPISWRKTALQTILLFVFMGIGKALGGIFSDMFGIKKTAMGSIILALPLLAFGDNNMYLSLIGVMFFSMTMPVTLAVILSVLKRAPGLAFGFTTIGLFLGTLPVFFFKIKSFSANCIMLCVLTAVCLLCFFISIRKDERYERLD
ncbi:MAG: hypothetical protein K5761_03405 [Clostridiales bacterium]|nr:hypothetical protein [Clostridiales bacterium]